MKRDKLIEKNEIAEELIDISEELDKVERAATRSGINDFNELVLKDKNNNPITQGQIHRFWNWFIDTCLLKGRKRIGICAPMEHGKTNQISIGRILHSIGLDPNMRIKLVSCIDNKAKEKTTAVKKIIQYSEEYQAIFPKIKPSKDDSWTGHRLVVNREAYGTVDATLESQSVTAEGIGGRCDLLVFDDVVDEQNSMTEGQRKKIRGLCNQTWLTRIDDDLSSNYEGIVLYVGTAWHEDDVMHYWMNNDGSGFAFLKMGISEDFNRIDWCIYNADDIFKRDDICFDNKEEFRGQVEGHIDLWEKKPKKVLMAKCISDEEGEGQRFFDRAYRNKFVSSEEQIFAAIMEYKDWTLDSETVMNEESWFSFMGVDLAISKTKGSAYTVFVVGKKDHKGRKYLADVIRGRFSSPSTAAIALGLAMMYNIEIGMIENNAYQQSLLEWIELFKDDLELDRGLEVIEQNLDRKYDKFLSKDIKPELWSYIKPYLLECGKVIINFKPYTTGKQKMSEEVGLPAFASEIVSGQWVVPWMGHVKDPRIEYCGCDICKVLQEMVGYPGAKYKDGVMAWFFVSRAMKSAQLRIRSFADKKKKEE